MYRIRANGYLKRSTLTEYTENLEKKTEVTLAYNTAWIDVFVKNGQKCAFLAHLDYGGSIWLKKVHKIEYEPLEHSLIVRVYGEV